MVAVAKNGVNEWLLLNANSPIFHTIWREQVNFQWDDDEVRFVLDQHAELGLYSASSLKQQSAGRYMTMSLHSEHIILIPSRSVCSFSLMVYV